MNKEEVKRILLENNVSVKKQYGQNFLLDENVLNNIVTNANINKNSFVIEIGPGLGFLTNYLSKYANNVLCYEIDSEMVDVIKSRNYTNVDIEYKDFLKANVNEDIKKYNTKNLEVVVVANLPYYITTPILLKILEETSSVDRMVVMMQKEVALRICGKPSTKDYNCLSVLIQYFTNPKYLFTVKPGSFYPEPGVDSAVIEIKYKNEIENIAIDLNYFLKFNRNIFAQRRKTLMNNLQKSYSYDKQEMLNILENKNISSNIRSEALSVDEIVELANIFYQTFEKK